MERKEEIKSVHHYAFKKNKEKFIKLAKVGSGAYGKVYKAYSSQDTSKVVALKKIEYKPPDFGFPITALREIRLLKHCNHKNIVNLLDIISSKPSEHNNYHGSTFLVFEYMEHDIFSLLKAQKRFEVPQIKCIIKQILEGVEYLHSRGIMHRDLKSANILMNNKGEVKVADFGLARESNSPNGLYSNCVVTLWYRAPELLLGSKNYSYPIDVWSLGCIFAELVTGQILFKEQTEQAQFERICDRCGVPTESDWPGVKSLKYYKDFVPRRVIPRTIRSHMKELKPGIDEYTVDLIDKMLIMNPEKRITVRDALQHAYFQVEPLATEIKDMPHFNEEFHDSLMLLKKKVGEKEVNRVLNPEIHNRNVIQGAARFGNGPGQSQGSSQGYKGGYRQNDRGNGWGEGRRQNGGGRGGRYYDQDSRKDDGRRDDSRRDDRRDDSRRGSQQTQQQSKQSSSKHDAPADKGTENDFAKFSSLFGGLLTSSDAKLTKRKPDVPPEGLAENDPHVSKQAAAPEEPKSKQE